MMAEIATTSKKVDFKRKEEERIIEIFLEWFNDHNRTNFEVFCRPENKMEEVSKNVQGTYDYLCNDNTGTQPELAVEITGLHRNEENVKQNVELRKLHTPIKNGLEIKENYILEIRFWKPQVKRELQLYVDEINKFVKTNFAKCHKLGRPVKSSIPVCPLMKYIRIHPKDSVQALLFLCLTGNELHGEEPITDALKSVLIDNQPKLQMAKINGKTTILIVSNQFIFADSETLEKFFPELPYYVHEGIDQVYFLDENYFEQRRSIVRLK